MYKQIMIIIVMLVISLNSFAQLVQPSENKLDTLDQWIHKFMEDNIVPGALVAVASRGEILHLKSYGMANVELDVPVTDSTVFEIGSISKQFVVTAAMILVQENKLGLDDPIHKFLPELPSEWLGVNIRQLMTHTSGIPDYEEIRSYDVYRFRLTPEEVIQIAHSRPMDFPPGSGYYYSNTGYFILSMIVERVEGRPLGEVLKSRVFDPVGMTQTRLADPEAIIKHRAAGYWVNKVGDLINRNPTETSSTLGAGGILSSVYDMIKWDESLYGNELLTDKSKKMMWTQTVLPEGDSTGYGFGWRLRPYEELRQIEHGGMVAGFVARFSRYPEQEAVVIVFMNRYQVSSMRLSRAVLHTFMPSLGGIPD